MRLLRSLSVLAFLVGSLVLPGLVLAGSGPDGVGLSLTKGPGPDQVTLSWAGGTAPYSVYRSFDAGAIVLPGNELGETSAPSWVDTPPPGSILFYAVTMAPTVESIVVAPANPAVPAGFTQPFRATATLSDGTTEDVTSSATWFSSHTSRATVSNAAGSQGVVTCLSMGTSVITARIGTVAGSTTVTVTGATLTSIQVTPSSSSLPSGRTQHYQATGTFSDGTARDITSDVTWSSSSVSVASVSNAAATKGLVTAVSPGTADIVAHKSSVAGSTSVTVTAAVLSSIVLTPSNPTVPELFTVAIRATGNYSDGSSADVTDAVTWSSSEASVASVSNAAGSKGLVTALASGTSEIVAHTGSVVGSTTVTVTDATLVSIEVTPSNPSLPAGQTRQLTATATLSDGSTRDITSDASWSSDNSPVATVSNAAASKGVATGVSPGTTNITASLRGVAGSTAVTVTNAVMVSITIMPTSLTVPVGFTIEARAIATFSDGTSEDVTESVMWSSSDPVVVSVSNAAGSRGQLTGVAPGTSNVTAHAGALSGATTVTVSSASLVSIQVSSCSSSLPAGHTVQCTATATFSDGTARDVTNDPSVIWSSSDVTVASVSNAEGSKGLVSALSPGSATIVAHKGPVAGSSSVTVTDAVLSSILVIPASTLLPGGYSFQLRAIGHFSDGSTADVTNSVTWSSSNAALASVSNAAGTRGVVTGVATGVATGTCEIVANAGPIAGSATVTVTDATLISVDVTPASPTLQAGRTQQFTATGLFSDGSTLDITEDARAAWSSSSPTVASVSNAAGSKGLATALTPGTTSLSVSLEGIIGSTTMTVTDAVVVSIVLSPPSPTVPVSFKVQFTATATLSDGTTSDVTDHATWSSSMPTVVSISNGIGEKGVATGVAPGTTTITATVDGVVGSTSVTVSSASLLSIEVTPSSSSLPAGHTQQFTATGIFSDGSSRDLTNDPIVVWSSSNVAVASVDNTGASRGVVTGVAPGMVEISAHSGSVAGTTALTVTDATLVTIVVTPSDSSLPVGFTQQAHAICTFSDGESRDCTDLVTWTSSNPTIATVSNAAGSRGLVTSSATMSGSATITAISNGVAGSTTVTVTDATLVSLEVTPSSSSLPAGRTQQFTATGVFSDGTTRPLATDASLTWTSTAPSVATVSNAAGSRGLATGVSSGTTMITATCRGIVASTTMTVTDAVVVSIVLSPVNPTVPVGFTSQIRATGTYSDGSNRDVTAHATWTSSNPAFATVSNAAASKGIATGVAPGTTTITATVDGVVGSTSVTVSSASLLSIEVTPSSSSLPAGHTQQFTATGIFSDGSSRDLTNDPILVWSSSNVTVASVDNTGASRGVVTGVAPGMVEISAHSGSVAGTTALTVTDATLVTIVVTPSDSSLPVGFTQQAHAICTFSDGESRTARIS